MTADPGTLALTESLPGPERRSVVKPAYDAHVDAATSANETKRAGLLENMTTPVNPAMQSTVLGTMLADPKVRTDLENNPKSQQVMKRRIAQNVAASINELSAAIPAGWGLVLNPQGILVLESTKEQDDMGSIIGIASDAEQVLNRLNAALQAYQDPLVQQFSGTDYEILLNQILGMFGVSENGPQK